VSTVINPRFEGDGIWNAVANNNQFSFIVLANTVCRSTSWRQVTATRTVSAPTVPTTLRATAASSATTSTSTLATHA